MGRLLSIVALLVLWSTAHAQITITASDMPVSGDMLVYSNVAPATTNIMPGDSGVNVTWAYSLTPTTQGVDTYQTAAAVNLIYALTVGTTAYGYKVADSIPIPLLPVSIQQVYTFFEEKTSPSRFEAKAFAASISGAPVAANYSKPDIWYNLPLTYLRTDSTPIALKIPIPGVDTLNENGYRSTRVDAWGEITTPYFTTPVSCIRVRSEVHLVDSVSVFGFKVGFPQNTVEYKWLVNGYHYPALWVTSTLLPGGGEQMTTVRYMDTLRSTDTTVVDTSVAVHQVSKTNVDIRAYPNPALNGIVHLSLPADWNTFDVEVYDLQSKRVAAFKNEKTLNIQSLPAGNYVARVTSGDKKAYVQITR